ncbi:uncharacterized protein si:ch211-131k2.2 [Onychostoma macrolepis]|uniref:uncharacterized protein si:ch211-131k2.2 n=1 Tax=Onychostoma macrolepis TaxID=369639 RepID=UPI002729CA93|nr:uncharacterized protein si:ch211-131k2.2 [Onychostoma macrolepis]
MGKRSEFIQPVKMERRRHKGDMFVGLMGKRSSGGDFRKTIPETSTAMDKSGDLNKQAGTTLKVELYLCKNDEKPAVYECEIMLLFTQQICKRNGTDCSTTDDIIQCSVNQYTNILHS